MNIQIADIKLPEKSVENIISILESNNMPVRLPNGGGTDFNCWGFTAYYCQWITHARWLEGRRMEALLRDNSEPISKEDVKAGDVAIFHRGEYLSHTAIVLPNGTMICHKPGSTPLCIDSIEAAARNYGDVTYARAKEKKENEEELISPIEETI